MLDSKLGLVNTIDTYSRLKTSVVCGKVFSHNSFNAPNQILIGFIFIYQTSFKRLKQAFNYNITV